MPPTARPRSPRSSWTRSRFRYASVLRTIETLNGGTLRGVQIVGGGSQNRYLNQMTATFSGLPVRAGPVEATVTGNVLVQAIAGGRFTSLADARRHVADRLRLPEIVREAEPVLESGAAYAALEAPCLCTRISESSVTGRTAWSTR